MSEIADLDLFIGTKSSYDKYKRQNSIEIDEPEDQEEPKKREVLSNVSVLSKETLKPIDEDMLTILKRTRTVHKFDTVYMQSSLDFYDEYYNDANASEELKAARQIRRVYKVYVDYLNALEIRNRYIDSLVEKYGGEEEFQRKMSIGLIKDWIPKMPILSKRSPDYEMYLSGMLPLETKTLPEGTIEQVVESMQEDIDDVDLIETYSVEDCMGVINQYGEIMDSVYSEYGFSKSKSNTVTISDLEDLNKIFKSWYKPDSGKVEHVLFKNAPENIKKRFYEHCSFNHPGLLTRVINGEEIDTDEVDMNEMVYDDVTGKHMSRKELLQRQTIRLLAENGWSESRLLNYANVGSKLERMARKKRVSRKRKRSSTEFESMMNDPTGLDPIYSENDYMSQAFMSLMRGDE